MCKSYHASIVHSNSINIFSVAFIKAKWKVIKDSFTKSYKVYLKKKGNNVTAKKPSHLQLMEFFIPHINPRQINQALKKQARQPSASNEDSVNSTHTFYNAEAEIPQESSQTEEDPPVLIKEDPLTCEYDDEDQSNLNNSTLNFSNSQTLYSGFAVDNMDNTEAFFLSLARTVNKLSPLKQAVIKKTVANIVLDMEIREAQEKEQQSKPIFET